MDKVDWPEWLQEASISDADVEICRGVVIWKGGVWKDGTWKGGVWQGGIWQGGVWKDGTWKGGVWKDGTWKGGVWQGGIWQGGTWKARENRIFYMAALAGVAKLENGNFIGYRTTLKDGKGRFTAGFVQREGYYVEDVPGSAVGTCAKGVHITSAARAWTYFGVDPTCEFWRVEVKPEDILACDGEKARIRGGIFTKVSRPF
ncbi:MAG: hypothetical protein ACRCZI_02985 [Cetobacterium sp.]